MKLDKFEGVLSTYPVNLGDPSKIQGVYKSSTDSNGVTVFTPPPKFIATYGSTITNSIKGKETVSLKGSIGIQAYYFDSSSDIEATKTHERNHVSIWSKYWNMIVDEVNWVEGTWCKPCGELAAS